MPNICEKAVVQPFHSKCAVPSRSFFVFLMENLHPYGCGQDWVGWGRSLDMHPRGSPLTHPLVISEPGSLANTLTDIHWPMLEGVIRMGLWLEVKYFVQLCTGIFKKNSQDSALTNVYIH